MSELGYLRERAQDCRQLAGEEGGRDAADALLELALIYDWQADCEQERRQGQAPRTRQ